MVGLGGSGVPGWLFPTDDRLLAQGPQSVMVPNRTVPVSAQCGRRSRSRAWLHQT